MVIRQLPIINNLLFILLEGVELAMLTTQYAALQAATILVAMASGNKIWRLNFQQRSPIWQPV